MPLALNRKWRQIFDAMPSMPDYTKYLANGMSEKAIGEHWQYWAQRECRARGDTPGSTPSSSMAHQLGYLDATSRQVLIRAQKRGPNPNWKATLLDAGIIEWRFYTERPPNRLQRFMLRRLLGMDFQPLEDGQ